jgi:HTH-type transcriptional regulator/antitoxin HipB
MAKGVGVDALAAGVDPGVRRDDGARAGLTQREVALRLGVTQQTYSVLERNADTIGAARLLKLLNILGVELALSRPSQAADGSAVPGQMPRDKGQPHW